ncbi:glycoside hydrolase family 95-like protein [Planctomycetota bacterium]
MSKKVDFTAMVKSHVLEHQRLFSRVDLSLGEATRSDIPIDQRLSQLQAGEPDLGLVSLYFQLGRYLLISSSRPGGLAANLRGIWNDMLDPPWSADYHYDFNLQMNYWPAEVCNLSECAEPLFDHVEKCLPAARVAAKNLYDCRGIYIPLTNDAALKCLKTEGRWSEWTGAAAWLAQHFWWHWEFTGDEQFLRNRAYPLYKDIGLFYQDYLVKDPRKDSPHYGKLVTVPSQSPENFFVGGTEPVSLCIGATMDFELIHEVFTNLIEASEILNVDADKRPEWQSVLDNIPPLQVGKHGQLQEWLEDYEEAEVQHRHRSHLYAVYPGDQITVEETPRFANAAYVSVQRRIQGSPRYEASAGGLWMAGIWARLGEPDMAEIGVRAEIARCGPNMVRYRTIDKSYGIPAIIAEMLLQSHNGVIRLLPALPKAWLTGHVKGLRARGGFEVDIAWRNGQLTQARIKSLIGSDCRIRSDVPFIIKTSGNTVKTSEVETAVFEFATSSGNIYTLTP